MTLNRERRQAKRIPCRQPVQLQHGSLPHPISGMIEDISSTGLRVAAIAPIRAGQRVLCSVFLQDHPVEAACRVVWVHGDNSHPQVGLMFEELSLVESSLLQRFIARLSANLQPSSLVFDPYCTSGTWAPEYMLGEDTVIEAPRQPQPQPPRTSKLTIAVTLLLVGVLAALIVLQVMRL